MATCPAFLPAHVSTPLRPLSSCAIIGMRSCLVLALCFGASPTIAQPQSNAPALAAPATSSTASSKPAVSGPLWTELTVAQRQALQPLAPHWNGLHVAHKNKWLALSRDYAKLSPAEQATLQTRMTEWASLSPRQRTLARLNFAEVKQIPADERLAKWEAYQALSADEKHQLAERANALPHGATALVRPVPAGKLAPTPSPKSKGHPRIQLTPPKPASKPPPQAALPPAIATPLAPAGATTTLVPATPVLPQAPLAASSTAPQTTPAVSAPAKLLSEPPLPGVRPNDLPALGG